LATSLSDKVARLREGLLPRLPSSEMDPPTVRPCSEWPKLAEREIDEAIAQLNDRKAPGPDGIKASAIRVACNNEAISPHLQKLFKTCVQYGYHPQPWRSSYTVVLRKPKDYGIVKAYRPISLFNILGKVLEKIIQDRLTYLTKEILP
jgi:hypothetical protein